MNTIQLKIRVKSINVSHFGKDSKLMITGECKFHHYDSTSPNKKKTRTLKYKAFGYAAQTLQKMNANTTYIIRGYIDIYPPNKQYQNHQTILNISTAIPVNIVDTTEYNQIVSKPQFNTTDSLEAFTPSIKETSLEEVNTTATITKTVEPITETIEPITETVEPITETVEPITETVEPITETVEPITETIEPITETVESITETVEPVTETDMADQSNNSVVNPESLSYKELNEFVKVHNRQETVLDLIGKPYNRYQRKELIKALTA